MNVERLIISYLVFLGFAIPALWTKQVYMTLNTYVRWPFKPDQRAQYKLRENIPLVRAIAWVGAVGAGVMAIGITIQEIWTLT